MAKREIKIKHQRLIPWAGQRQKVPLINKDQIWDEETDEPDQCKSENKHMSLKYISTLHLQFM